jgi:cell division protein DivIC
VAGRRSTLWAGLPRPSDLPAWVRRVALVAFIGGAAVLMLAAPVRGWWTQRSDIADERAELAAVRADNEELERRLDRIEDPGELERIARRDLGLVREGEESYTVLPPPPAGLILPDAWPFDRIAPALVSEP